MKFSIASLEKMMNTYLQLDPDTPKRLADLQNKVVRIQVQDWDITVNIKIDDNQLRFISENEVTAPDTTINSTLFKLLKSVKQKGVFFDKDLSVDGDALIAQQLRDCLQKLDIDWEERLSHFTSDSFAHKFLFYAHETLKFGKRSFNILKNNFQEYLHEEVGLAPSTLQLEELYEAIAVLKNDVDRLEARINLLTLTTNPS